MMRKRFWADTAERALATAAQFLLGYGAADLLQPGFDWRAAGVGLAVATFGAVFKALVAAQIGEPTASLLPNDAYVGRYDGRDLTR